jgi:hypothetical protein
VYLLLLPAQSARFEFFPLFFLLTIKLARQSFDGNTVLRAEVSPQDKTQIEGPGFIGDDVVYVRFLLLSGGHI